MSEDLQRKEMHDVHDIEKRLQSFWNKVYLHPMPKEQFDRELYKVVHDIIHVAEEYQTDDLRGRAEQMIEESVEILLKEN